jgi:molecular chaperone HscB
LQDKKEIAQSLSTLVNEAYQGLSAPLLRAEYILNQNGYKMSETEQLTDVHFISEVMEAREELEEANDRDSVERVAEANNSEYVLDDVST